MRPRARSVGIVFLAAALGAPPVGGQGSWVSFSHEGETHCLAANGDGTAVWSGTNAGIRLYELHGGEVTESELGPAQGLPGRAVTALCFEPDGVWVGTAAGRAERLDLLTNEWRETIGLPAARVNELHCDGHDAWAATDLGVARYNPLKQEWEVYDERDGLASPKVACLASDADGVWAGTERGLYRFSNTILKWDRVSDEGGRLSGRITDLAQAGGFLWIASVADGLCRVELADQTLRTYDLRTDYGVERVDRVAIGPDGDVYVACDRGLVIAPGMGLLGPWQLVEREGWLVSDLAVAGGCVWASTATEGVCQYDPRTGEWTSRAPEDELPSSAIVDVAVQADRGWFAFANDGLAVYDTTAGRWQTLAPPEGVPHQARAVAVSGNRVYVACRDGLAVYDQRFGNWSAYLTAEHEWLRGDEWTSVAVSADQVYVAGPGRVVIFSLEMEHQHTWLQGDLDASADGRLPRLHIDERTGDVWVVTPVMARRYQPRQEIWGDLGPDFFRPPDAAWRPDEPLIRDIASDVGSVWFVAQDSVVEYNNQDARDYHWGVDENPALASPWRVSSDRFFVWFATSAGLLRYDRQQNVLSLDAWPQELAEGQPTALVSDPYEAGVWVATARSVARLELGGDTTRWRVITPRTGIIEGVRRIVPSRDAVWFCGPTGVSIYRRERAPGG